MTVMVVMRFLDSLRPGGKPAAAMSDGFGRALAGPSTVDTGTGNPAAPLPIVYLGWPGERQHSAKSVAPEQAIYSKEFSIRCSTWTLRWANLLHATRSTPQGVQLDHPSPRDSDLHVRE